MTVSTDFRILLIDSYDSFTYNLASLCRRAIPGCSIHIVKNDQLTPATLFSIARHFSAIIVGPGPGSPDCLEDIGIIEEVWKLCDIPVFGVCLGLQTLALEFGGQLKRLNVVKHGQISNIEHSNSDIFEGVGEVNAVRYHSLHVAIESTNALEPLAWADDGEENGKILMAVRHKDKPYWAVQYHPESVCTDGGGIEVVANFWRLASSWSSNNSRIQKPWESRWESIVGPAWPHYPDVHLHSPSLTASEVTTLALRLPGVELTSICEAFGVGEDSSDFVMLESAAQPGRFSIIGCLNESTARIIYFVGDSYVQVRRHGRLEKEKLGSRDIWTWIAEFMRERRATGGLDHVPFWGGLVGYLSYEQGVQSVSPELPRRSPRRHPDVSLVFVERSIVLDHTTDEVVIQSLVAHDDQWMNGTADLLRKVTYASSNGSSDAALETPTPTVLVHLPDRDQYISRIKEAKEHLFCGNSYEICLTAPTKIVIPKNPSSLTFSSSWQLFKTLRRRNPAPYSAYLRLHPSTFLSSSPERFLSFSRPPNMTCQLRPIKGTVRKAPGITRAVAEQALRGSNKEVAENLMIVDLIRHDLHSVVGSDVQVKQFCTVEEYQTVWQLVSVIEGRPSRRIQSNIDFGWEVLRQSLPPGSMTGAPKKRSVEILHDLEDNDRGIYSGVFGYWCVGGSGDWAVIIRSCFKYDPRFDCDDQTTTDQPTSTNTSVDSDEWVLGAGGAITALSDPDAEWDEMMVKVESVLRAFNVSPSSS